MRLLFYLSIFLFCVLVESVTIVASHPRVDDINIIEKKLAKRHVAHYFCTRALQQNRQDIAQYIGRYLLPDTPEEIEHHKKMRSLCQNLYILAHQKGDEELQKYFGERFVKDGWEYKVECYKKNLDFRLYKDLSLACWKQYLKIVFVATNNNQLDIVEFCNNHKYELLAELYQLSSEKK